MILLRHVWLYHHACDVFSILFWVGISSVGMINSGLEFIRAHWYNMVTLIREIQLPLLSDQNGRQTE